MATTVLKKDSSLYIVFFYSNIMISFPHVKDSLQWRCAFLHFPNHEIATECVNSYNASSQLEFVSAQLVTTMMNVHSGSLKVL